MMSVPVQQLDHHLLLQQGRLQEGRPEPRQAPTTWPEVFEAAKKLKASGHSCPMTLAWQGWTQLESFSAWHNVEFATEKNGLSPTATRRA